MDQVAFNIYAVALGLRAAIMGFPPVGKAICAALIPLVALLGLVHLWIPLALLGFRRARRGNQGDIDARSLLHGHAISLDVILHRLKDFLPKVVLLRKVAEGHNRRLVWDLLADQVDPRETSHHRHLDQGVLHGLIAQRVPVLHQVDPEHGFTCIGQTPSSGAFLQGLLEVIQKVSVLTSSSPAESRGL